MTNLLYLKKIKLCQRKVLMCQKELSNLMQLFNFVHAFNSKNLEVKKRLGLQMVT